jgi:hypothetical protein
VAVHVDAGLHARAAAEQRLINASPDQKEREMLGRDVWFGRLQEAALV